MLMSRAKLFSNSLFPYALPCVQRRVGPNLNLNNVKGVDPWSETDCSEVEIRRVVVWMGETKVNFGARIWGQVSAGSEFPLKRLYRTLLNMPR